MIPIPPLGRHTQLTDLYQRTSRLARSLGDEDLASQLDAAALQLDSDRVRLVVAGEFKRGKSSLVNALLRQPGLCPVDPDIATCLPMQIRYGDTERFQVVLGEKGDDVRSLTREQVATYVDERHNPGNRLGARMLLAQVPAPFLRRGVVLLDTPGVHGVNEQHTRLTYAALAEADLTLFVIAADCPLSTSELELARVVQRHSPAILFVVNKVDKASSPQTCLRENRDKLARALQMPAADIVLFAASSKCMLEYVRSGEQEDLEDSKFPAMEEWLSEHLGSNRQRLLVGAAAARLGQALDRMRTPLLVRLDAGSGENPDRLGQLEQHLQQAQERLTSLRHEKAGWQQELSQGLAAIERTVRDRLTSGIGQLRRQLEDDLQIRANLVEPARLAESLTVGLSALFLGIGRELNERVQRLHSDLAASSGLTLPLAEARALATSQLGMNRPLPESDRTGAVQRVYKVTGDVIVVGGQQGLYGALAGAGVGGLLVLAGPIGWVTIPLLLTTPIVGAKVGALIGFVKGAVEGGRARWIEIDIRDEAVARQKLGMALHRHLDDGSQEAQRLLDQALSELREALRRNLQEQIQAEMQTCQQSIQSLRDSQKLSREEAERQTHEVRGQLEQIEALDVEARQLIDAMQTLPSRE